MKRGRRSKQIPCEQGKIQGKSLTRPTSKLSRWLEVFYPLRACAVRSQQECRSPTQIRGDLAREIFRRAL